MNVLASLYFLGSSDAEVGKILGIVFAKICVIVWLIRWWSKPDKEEENLANEPSANQNLRTGKATPFGLAEKGKNAGGLGSKRKDKESVDNEPYYKGKTLVDALAGHEKETPPKKEPRPEEAVTHSELFTTDPEMQRKALWVVFWMADIENGLSANKQQEISKLVKEQKIPSEVFDKVSHEYSNDLEGPESNEISNVLLGIKSSPKELRTKIFHFAQSIASADGEIEESEKKSLELIEKEWGLSSN
ncbi:hypothetical protein OAG38_05790 [Akkermansiaceae bacterium]|nr:hypothetical protein [Akkermansiaceae bacterium]